MSDKTNESGTLLREAASALDRVKMAQTSDDELFHALAMHGRSYCIDEAIRSIQGAAAQLDINRRK